MTVTKQFSIHINLFPVQQVHEELPNSERNRKSWGNTSDDFSEKDTENISMVPR